MRDAFAHCEALVRASDKDRFLATLFAPAEHRDALFALYAFNVDITRVREVAHQPLAGEIRLQWWNDVLSGAGRGEVAAYPEAAAVLASIARYQLPVERFQTLISTRRFDLYDDPIATVADLEAYADGAASNLIALAGQILAPDRSSDLGALSHHAGVAHATVGLLKAFPTHAARSQLFVPVSSGTPGPALLPSALVGPTLARMERPDYDPFVPVEIPPWRRPWLIWRAARRPTRIFR